MLIAVASKGDKIDSNVSEHFGRCPYYILIEVDKEQKIKNVRAVKNPYVSHMPGQVPQFIKSLGAQVIISGGMGIRAIELFKEFNITPATGAHGTVKEAINDFINKKLKAQPCDRSKEDNK